MILKISRRFQFKKKIKFDHPYIVQHKSQKVIRC